MDRLLGRVRDKLPGGRGVPQDDTKRTPALVDKGNDEKTADAPPPYTPYPPTAVAAYTRDNMTRADDAYYFLFLFDTAFLIDDSSSMLGRRWREVHAALRVLAPICTSHDDDGIDVYFMNHEADARHQAVPRGKAPGGFYGLRDARAVDAVFSAVRPCGPTPTRRRIEAILNAYLIQLQLYGAASTRPLNLIVITDGMPGPARADGTNPHEPGPAMDACARRLDGLVAPPYQVGLQFIQVGDDADATRALARLDCREGARRRGVRDMVDTTPFAGCADGVLTPDCILKAVLGGVDRRLDADG